MVTAKLYPSIAGRPRITEEYFELYPPSIEQTGKGNLLCFEGYGGRIFRSSYDAVKEDIALFVEKYYNGEYVSLNDLYAQLGLIQTTFGSQYGWSPSEEYKVTLRFNLEMAEPDEISDVYAKNLKFFNEPVLLIDIDSLYSLPIENYWEV